MNCMFNEVEYFHVKRENQTVFSEKWEEYSKEFTDSNRDDKKAVLPATPAGSADKLPETAAVKGGRAKRAKDSNPDHEAQTDSKKLKTNSLISVAQKVKREYHSATSSAVNLISTIDSAIEPDPWVRFQVPANVGELNATREKVEACISSEVRPVLINEISQMKKTSATTS